MLNLLSYNNNYYYGGGGYGGYYFDGTYLLIVIAFLITLAAQMFVNSTFKKYNKVRTRSGLTGAQAARQVLDLNGLYNVRIEHISGSLTDHYDPRSKTLRLSDSTIDQPSVAAVCVAAHECGHAVQDQAGYGPLVLRSALVPAASISSQLAWPLFFIGLIMSLEMLTTAGINLFSVAVVFQLITLPVEFNASRRALKILGDNHIIPADELSGGRKVLTAAALTYVAALASSILQLLRLIALANRRRD